MESCGRIWNKELIRGLANMIYQFFYENTGSGVTNKLDINKVIV